MIFLSLLPFLVHSYSIKIPNIMMDKSIYQRMLAETTSEQCFGVILDAGSSSTKAFIYHWLCR